MSNNMLSSPVGFFQSAYYYATNCDAINNFTINHWIPITSLCLGFLSATLIYKELEKSQELSKIMTNRNDLNVLIIGILSSIAILFVAKVFEFGVRLGINLYENSDKANTTKSINNKTKNVNYTTQYSPDESSTDQMKKKPIKDIILETANRTFNPFYHCAEINE